MVNPDARCSPTSDDRARVRVQTRTCSVSGGKTASKVNVLGGSLVALMPAAKMMLPVFLSIVTMVPRLSRFSVELSGRHRTTTRTHSFDGAIDQRQPVGLTQAADS